MPVIPATQEAEAGESLEPSVGGVEVVVSQDHIIAFQPRQQSETVSNKNKNKKLARHGGMCL